MVDEGAGVGGIWDEASSVSGEDATSSAFGRWDVVGRGGCGLAWGTGSTGTICPSFDRLRLGDRAIRFSSGLSGVRCTGIWTCATLRCTS